MERLTSTPLDQIATVEDSTIRGNFSHGIVLINMDALVTGSVFDHNGWDGIAVQSNTLSYGGNMIQGILNTISTGIGGTALEIAPNVCNGSATCP